MGDCVDASPWYFLIFPAGAFEISFDCLSHFWLLRHKRVLVILIWYSRRGSLVTILNWRVQLLDLSLLWVGWQKVCGVLMLVLIETASTQVWSTWILRRVVATDLAHPFEGEGHRFCQVVGFGRWSWFYLRSRTRLLKNAQLYSGTIRLLKWISDSSLRLHRRHHYPTPSLGFISLCFQYLIFLSLVTNGFTSPL